MAELRGIAVGAGYFAQFHLEAWRRVADAQLVALCDADLSRATAASEKFGIPRAYASLAEALAAEQADFVDIITPPESHLGLVRTAAAAGVAIICQKPLAPSLSEAREVVAAAAQVRLMVHENFRFQPWHRELKRLIDAGTVGDKLHSLTMRTRMGDGWQPDAYLARQPYFRTMPRLLMYETGVHFVDTFRYLAGEIAEVGAILRRLNAEIAGEDAGLVTLRFTSGAVGVWDANRYNEATAANPRLTFGEMLIEGSRGSLRLYDNGRITVQRLGEAECEHAYQWEDRGFAGDCVRLTQQHFVECLASGTPFETSGAEYLKSLEVVEAAYAAANRGQTIQLAPQPDKRMVDLTRPVDANLPGFEVQPARTLERDGWNATTLTLYSHSGTHIDAACHFLPAGATLDELDLARCWGPAWVVNLTPVAPRELLTVERLGAWAERIQPGDRVLLRTDWSLQYPGSAYRDALPRISEELARWFVDRGVVLVGVEPPSVADVNNLPEVTAIHHILLQGGVTIVEGLVNLNQLSCERVELVVLPLRIAGGDGSPVRAIARVGI